MIRYLVKKIVTATITPMHATVTELTARTENVKALHGQFLLIP
jgi:hypothetical protein